MKFVPLSPTWATKQKLAPAQEKALVNFPVPPSPVVAKPTGIVALNAASSQHCDDDAIVSPRLGSQSTSLISLAPVIPVPLVPMTMLFPQTPLLTSTTQPA